ncbi:MAG: FKBP-type peptidyl-prolyl cis-trans isomerase [Bacteroidales bacterium]|nr:FKBP-type peptidyl-prolyl cis-trans isomerase [Bacteroidales bacterium]
MKNSIIGAIVFLFIFSACKQEDYSNFELKTELDTITYLIATDFATQIHKGGGMDSISEGALLKAFSDAFNEKEIEFERNEINQILTKFFRENEIRKVEKKFADNKISGEKFLEENKNKEEIITLSSGLQYEILKEGTGPKPELNNIVSVHYKGSLVDGTVFESSYNRDPVIFGVDKVIPGWTEALQLMNVGSKWITYIPYQLAYGTEFRPNSPITPYSALIFEIELISIESGEQDN